MARHSREHDGDAARPGGVQAGVYGSEVTAFEFATATRIVFGAGAFAQLESIAVPFGKRPLVVTGRKPRFSAAGPVFAAAKEPTIDLIRDGVAAFRDAECDMVIAIGGGSAIDA